ncbi:hypothetical protein FRC09_017000 [Ceratobasidium sp. 395]|nr:hypothetical protein FRC09_017000 [Ceratobasidium sp. 395]
MPARAAAENVRGAKTQGEPSYPRRTHQPPALAHRRWRPAMSVPITPPRANSVLSPLSARHALHDHNFASTLSCGLAPGSRLSNGSLFSGVNFGTPQSAFHSPANTTEKRKLVNYADFAEYTTYSPDASATHAHAVAMPSVSQFGSHTHTAGAKSMPGSRRGSGNHGDLPGINLQGLSICDGSNVSSTAQAGILKNGSARIFGPTATLPTKGLNPGFLLDEELDEVSRDMHKDEAKSLLRSDSYSKLSASSAALDLAPLSQTTPRGPGPNSRLVPALKSSEWPQFSAAPCTSEGGVQPRLRNVTNPGPIGGSRPSSGMGRNSSSPTGIQDGGVIVNHSAKSVSATPMSARQSVGSLSGKPVGLSGGDMASFAQEQSGPAFNVKRLSGAYNAPVTFNSLQFEGVWAEDQFCQAGSQSSPFNVSYLYTAGRAPARVFYGRHVLQPLWTLFSDVEAPIRGPAPASTPVFLQKKLEEGVPKHRDIIFHKMFSLFAELMTDPFGNYLCQKLLQYSTDEQRNMICESVMINFLLMQRQANPTSYDVQIHSIIMALSMHVVTLIKDLNGNHVVQKCLNRLIPEDNQFIYNAVAAHCVEVATHRHGCCVLQRCIDHASDSQRIQLVTEITFNVLTLVQDPYGNYVMQYILDLNDNQFSDAVIRQFVGSVVCPFGAKIQLERDPKVHLRREHNIGKFLIEELLIRDHLEKLPRDSLHRAQTALDYAELTQHGFFVKGIRLILPLIRNTPYGKRTKSKLQHEQMGNHRRLPDRLRVENGEGNHVWILTCGRQNPQFF